MHIPRLRPLVVEVCAVVQALRHILALSYWLQTPAFVGNNFFNSNMNFANMVVVKLKISSIFFDNTCSYRFG